MMGLVLPLNRHHYCRCTDANFGNLWQAWTTSDLTEALARPDYFKNLLGAVQAGDTIELIQVYREHLDRPETDPLAMATVIITEIETDRSGTHVRWRRTGEVLRFEPNVSMGKVAAWWNGKARVFEDGKRIASFNTMIEAEEFASGRFEKKRKIA